MESQCDNIIFDCIYWSHNCRSSQFMLKFCYCANAFARSIAIEFKSKCRISDFLLSSFDGIFGTWGMDTHARKHMSRHSRINTWINEFNIWNDDAIKTKLELPSSKRTHANVCIFDAITYFNKIDAVLAKMDSEVIVLGISMAIAQNCLNGLKLFSFAVVLNRRKTD